MSAFLAGAYASGRRGLSRTSCLMRDYQVVVCVWGGERFGLISVLLGYPHPSMHTYSHAHTRTHSHTLSHTPHPPSAVAALTTLPSLRSSHTFHHKLYICHAARHFTSHVTLSPHVVSHVMSHLHRTSLHMSCHTFRPSARRPVTSHLVLLQPRSRSTCWTSKSARPLEYACHASRWVSAVCMSV